MRSLTGSGMCGPCMNLRSLNKQAALIDANSVSLDDAKVMYDGGYDEGVKAARLEVAKKEPEYSPGYVAPGPFADERDYYDDSDTNDRDASETETVSDGADLPWWVYPFIAVGVVVAIIAALLLSHNGRERQSVDGVKKDMFAGVAAAMAAIMPKKAAVVAPAARESDGRVYIE